MKNPPLTGLTLNFGCPPRDRRRLGGQSRKVEPWLYCHIDTRSEGEGEAMSSTAEGNERRRRVTIR